VIAKVAILVRLLQVLATFAAGASVACGEAVVNLTSHSSNDRQDVWMGFRVTSKRFDLYIHDLGIFFWRCSFNRVADVETGKLDEEAEILKGVPDSRIRILRLYCKDEYKQ
jgi:hypothetical protein